MATVQQIEANRRNALKSTGPRTPEGKEAVRLNALRNGLRARTVVLPGEDPNEFQQLCDHLEAEWRPKSRTEQFYVEQMAVAQWKLTRMESAERSIFAQTTDAETQIPLVDRIWRCQSRAERSYASAQRELQRLQHARGCSARWQSEDTPVFKPPAPQPTAPRPQRPTPVVMAPVAAPPELESRPAVFESAVPLAPPQPYPIR